MVTRRAAIAGLLAGVALSTLDVAEARPGRRRTRRIRRRHRRRVRRQVVAGKSVLVVPVRLAVGWELLIDNVVYEVRTIKTVNRRETAVLVTRSGRVLTEVITRKDTPDNAIELEGSTIPDQDTSTPGIEVNVEVKVD